DEDEIRLTRRVQRSGEGEYLVNGRTCRLKDFRELLAGTGIGADSYSIIEQGRVDAALRASPIERRLLLEEAAGISRFRLKKREAAKRLERVEQNLLRLSDIVDEVEGRLRRVRSQAGKARRYREASLRLKEARTELAAGEWRQLNEERRRLDAEKASLADRLTAAEEEIASQDARLAHLQEQAGNDEPAERAQRESQQRLAKLDRQRAVDRAELARVEARVTALREEEAVARRNAAQAAKENPAQLALTAAEATAREYAHAIQGLQKQVTAAAERLDETQRRHDDESTYRSRVEALVTRIEHRVADLRRRQAALTATADELTAERDAAQAQATAAAAGLHEAVEQRDRAADALLAHDSAIADEQRRLTKLRAELSEQLGSVAAGREELVGLRHRHETIQEEGRRLERLNHDVRALIERAVAAGKRAPQVYGLVADLIHVEEDFVAMIEAALGPRAEHVVIGSLTALFEAINGVATPSLLTTRAGFEPLESNVAVTAVDQIDLTREVGVLGRAVDFVEVEPRFASLVRRLFARTWFVDSLATARRLIDSVGRGVTFVTSDGEVLAADGSLACGPRDGSVRLLTRRSDAEALRQHIAETESRVAAGESAVEASERLIAEAEASLAATQQAAEEQRTQLAAAAQQAAALEERRRQAVASVERVTSQATQRQAEATRLTVHLAALVPRRERLGTHLNDPAADVAEAIRRAENRLAGEQARLEELQAAAARHGELLESLRRESAMANDSTAGLDEAVRRLGAEREELVATFADKELAVLRVTAAIATESLRHEAASRRLAQSRAARRAGEQVRLEVAAALATLRAESEALRRRLGEMELRRQRVDLEADSVARQVRDDYGVEVAKLTASTTETTDQTDRVALREEVESLRREVQGIGAVNTESLEELDELEQRFAKLSEQYEDLSQAKKSLARLTTRINTDSRELFQATFETVRGHFRELFARLFGGGEADLVLVDPSDGEATDPLEGGVEIVACPPGKELRSLSLLSGGEKTMTCVALLLALFRSRPSPFCLLDEVDAALDEANVGRFLEVLKDFLGATQFVVVTHSKRTMAGADTMYGITMQESGVSKQVSVRFEEVSEEGQIRLRKPTEGNSLRRAA
ncbi:MAG: chromosome segregation protein SMC, partial [Planctomycetota bacterium]